MILNADKSSDANCDFQSVGKQQAEPEPTPEDEGYSITTATQDVIADEVKLQATNNLIAIPDKVEEVIEQLFSAFILSMQKDTCALVYEAIENVVLD